MKDFLFRFLCIVKVVKDDMTEVDRGDLGQVVVK